MPPPTSLAAPPLSLLAGAARVEITPATPQFLDGYGRRTQPSEGVYQPIYARALSLADAEGGEALLVAAEVLAYDHAQARRVREAIAAATGVPLEAVILTATHTHCAPRVCVMMMPGSIDPEYLAWFEEQLVEAAVQARGWREPVSAALGWTESTLGINRRLVTGAGTVMRPNPAGANDPTVATAWFNTASGAPLASLTVYACHPTACGGQHVGGDYPGYYSAAVEGRAGGAALFALGCAGDIRPNFTGEDGGFRPAAPAEVAAAGRELAERVLQARGGSEALPARRARVAREELHLPFADLPAPAELVAVAARDPDPLRRLWAERMLAASVVGLPHSAPFEIQVLGLAPGAAWVFMAGEMVVDYALALSRRADPAVIPAGYANGSAGYVPSRRIYPEGGYEVNGAYHYYAQPAPYAPEVEDAILEAARRLVEEAVG